MISTRNPAEGGQATAAERSTIFHCMATSSMPCTNGEREKNLGPRCRIVKNISIDMGVEDGRGRLVELYEVKTSTGPFRCLIRPLAS